MSANKYEPADDSIPSRPVDKDGCGEAWTAEVADRKGKVIDMVRVAAADLPEHIYCDTCGDCVICSPHDPESWCATGGRWVLYPEDSDYDAEIVSRARSQTLEDEQ